ncbi:MAG: carboxypeptidase regulatory-like domain-containing protein [Vicinamibacterales bacterium]
MRSALIGVGLAVVMSGSGVPALAQQGTSEITGRAVDAQGAALPGVAIVATNEDTGQYREATTSGEGVYHLAQMVPGRYAIVAKLDGFRTFERRGLILAVGTTLTVTLEMQIGALEESVTVTGASPIIDLTATDVGGNIGTGELAELPAMNRNYFATVALLPGVQFAPSTQMGNDTIVSNGQSAQNNNVSVDGGYNGDNALGTSAGAQVRTPLEAIQEFEVITSMYDAEYGRAGGAIVNAVTKTGTNKFSGVVFGYNVSNSLTSKDFIARQRSLPKAKVEKREYGFVLGGPIVRNKAHFFVSLERQVDKPTRTRTFSSRPERDFSLVEDRNDWNTLIRFDHQITANHTWAVRWLRETAPQFPVVPNRASGPEVFQDETDLDQTAVGTFTSVLGGTKVNTFRFAKTWEHWWHGNLCTRGQGQEGGREGFKFGTEDQSDMTLCAPQLNYLEQLEGGSTENQGPWDTNYQIEDNFSWFVPGKKGDHNIKVGGRYTYSKLRRVSQINQNGTFNFNTNLPFNPADPRTYPERLVIRIPNAYDATMTNHVYEGFVQDKWQINEHTTLSLGLRYDLEIFPSLDQSDNPLFTAGQKTNIDKNNFSPRIGFTRQLGQDGQSLVRAGYGIFYNRTILGALDDSIEFPKFTSSIVANFPNDNIDPNPSRGLFPTDPFLVNGPTVNRALLNQFFPPGSVLRNIGMVVYDSPDRRQPYAHQMTVGYVRQLASTLAFHADYVKIMNRDMFLSRNLLPMVRANTSRSGAITRVDAFGILGADAVNYRQQVWAFENNGSSDYDALNLQLEKRYASRWSGRISYSLSKSRGTATDQADRNTDQILTDMNLDFRHGPTAIDRRHVLSIAGRIEVPKTGGMTLAPVARYMSGSPFTIYNSNIDVNQNGQLDDPSPAGTYSGTGLNAMKDVKNAGGRFGAYGPDYFQMDVRAGWRRRFGDRTWELFVDAFNVTNRTNWDNPLVANSDERLPNSFLTLTNLRGGSGFPRSIQFGTRLAF